MILRFSGCKYMDYISQPPNIFTTFFDKFCFANRILLIYSQLIFRENYDVEYNNAHFDHNIVCQENFHSPLSTEMARNTVSSII